MHHISMKALKLEGLIGICNISYLIFPNFKYSIIPQWLNPYWISTSGYQKEKLIK